jgi:ABC-type lipoprotein export system ATPase subunit
VDARFEPGRPALVTGATGAGKTTLLAVLGGILRPTAGTVRHGRDPVSRFTAGHRDRWRRQVGIALQSPHLIEGLSVLENVMLPLVPLARSAAELRDRAQRALEDVQCARLAGEDASRLSGGERQRVALARAIVSGPSILLVDEPTAGQDDAGVDVVRGVLARAADGGAVVVAASHDPRLESFAPAGDTWVVADARVERLG